MIIFRGQTLIIVSSSNYNAIKKNNITKCLCIIYVFLQSNKCCIIHILPTFNVYVCFENVCLFTNLTSHLINKFNKHSITGTYRQLNEKNPTYNFLL